MAGTQRREDDTINEYELERIATIAGVKKKMESLNIPFLLDQLGATSSHRPRKVAKTTHGTNEGTYRDHNLRPRTKRNNAENEEGASAGCPEKQSEDDLLDTEDLNKGSSKKRKGRGITKKHNILSRGNQPKIKISFNEYGKPVGADAKEFANVIGTMVRKQISVACDDWRKVDAKKKFKLWTDLKLFYELEASALNYVMAAAAMKWREFKADLKKAFFDETLNDDELLAKRPESVNEDDCEWLINHWMSPEAEARTIRGKENRAKLTVLHTSGSKSYARVGHELNKSSTQEHVNEEQHDHHGATEYMSMDDRLRREEQDIIIRKQVPRSNVPLRKVAPAAPRHHETSCNEDDNLVMKADIKACKDSLASSSHEGAGDPAYLAASWTKTEQKSIALEERKENREKRKTNPIVVLY